MAATSAAIIVISLSGRVDLPVPVRQWMESWPNHKQNEHITLVVVFGTEQQDASRRNVLISYFQQIAADHGLDFLCHYNGAKSFPTDPEPSERANRTDVLHAERYQGFNVPAAANASS
jgi:hypothetical protein